MGTLKANRFEVLKYGDIIRFDSGIIMDLTAAAAPTNKGTVLRGFSLNLDKTAQVRAESFEVRDKEKNATFAGNVHVTQGDVTIRCRSLLVSYEPALNASPGPARSILGGQNRISQIEALGGVVVVAQTDLAVTGDRGDFDANANTITLIGNVVVSQGRNVMQGDRMVVNLTTGVSRIESSKRP
jgi:lipopolysaccharide export system protein LptA